MKLLPIKKARKAAGLALILVLCAGGYYAYNNLHRTSPLDAPMLSALEQAAKVTSYTQAVETQTTFPDRMIKISGTYYVDNPGKQFISQSTTTLFIGADSKGHSFTHDDITINNNVYFKVETSDPLLKGSIKSNPNWTSYVNGSIPADKTDIAIVGPLQDNLSILSDKGTYLTLVKKDGPATWSTESLLRYTFTLSKAAATVQDGPLKAIVGRLSPNGTVDVWIDPTTFAVRHMLFQNAPYYSTTTISGINVLTTVTPPIVAGS